MAFVLRVTHWLTRSIVIRVLRRGPLRRRTEGYKKIEEEQQRRVAEKTDSIAIHWRCDLRQLTLAKALDWGSER